MSIEFPTLIEFQHAFNSKMNAASFFVDQIKKMYQPESNIESVPDELFYYLDGVIFEFYAASQILLQIINIKSGTNVTINKVGWSRQFQSLLKEKNKKLFSWWEEIDSHPEYCILEAIRQHITHRVSTFLYADVSDGKIILLSIPVRFRYVKGKPESKPTGESIELLDKLVSIGKFINTKYYELQKL